MRATSVAVGKPVLFSVTSGTLRPAMVYPEPSGRSERREHGLALPSAAERYTLTAKQLQDTTVQLNGKTLQLNSSGDVPQFAGQSTRAGHLSFAPTGIIFLAVANAGNNNSCH